MRRTIVLAVAALAAGAVAMTAAATPGDDVKGPNCANITEGSVFYSFDGTTASGSVTLAAPACKGIVYTLVVLDNEIDVTPDRDRRGGAKRRGQHDLPDHAVQPPADGNVCVYYTSRSAGGHVFDRAPDATPSPNCSHPRTGRLCGQNRDELGDRE